MRNPKAAASFFKGIAPPSPSSVNCSICSGWRDQRATCAFGMLLTSENASASMPGMIVTLWALRASCNVGGTRKSASKILTVTRPKPFLSAELCSLRSSGILRTKSAGSSKIIGRAKMNVFAARTAELAEARPELAAAVEPLLKAREAVGRQIADLDRKVMRLARNDAQDAQVSLHVRSLSPRGHACNLTTLEFE